MKEITIAGILGLTFALCFFGALAILFVPGFFERCWKRLSRPLGIATPNNTTTVTATVVVSANAIMVRNGSVLTQGAGADYTASGTTVTFAVAPKVGDNLGFWQ